MTGPDEPRLATREEFPEMMELLDRYFAYERGGMAAHLPFAYDRDRADRHAVVVEDGRIVSHVAAIPQTLSLGPGTVECWGIGGVATDRRYRGNGYMSQLLEFWFDRMSENDVPLSDLSGNRQRYGHFGYELAGREYRYTLTERSFDGEPTPAESITVYDGADDHLDGLRRMHETEPYRVVRDRDESRTVFGQRGLETLLYLGKGDPAYVSLTRRSRSRVIEEFGGSPAGFEALLGHLLSVYDLNDLTVRAQPGHALEPVLSRHSRSWSSRPHRKIRINDLPGLLEGAREQLEERWGRSSRTDRGSITLGIAGGESVCLEYGPDSVSVEIDAEPVDLELELERRAMTSLLFSSPDRRGTRVTTDPFLETVLPIEFFVWASEHV